MRQAKTDWIRVLIEKQNKCLIVAFGENNLNKVFESIYCVKLQRGLLASESERRTGARVALGISVGPARVMSPKSSSRRLY